MNKGTKSYIDNVKYQMITSVDGSSMLSLIGNIFLFNNKQQFMAFWKSKLKFCVACLCCEK